MIKLKDIINEAYVWERKFGEPLPKLTFTKEPIITEDTKDIVQAKKLAQKLGKIEARLRETMYKLDERLNADIPNQKLSKPLRDTYRKNVTKFMREMLTIVKRMK